MPVLHVIAPFHTIPNDEFSHCAFTGKARRFAKMMRPFGYTVHEYSNAGSDSAADVKHVMLNDATFRMFFKPETSSPGAQANVGTPGWLAFHRALEDALRQYARAGDIIAHIWTAHDEMVRKFPGCIHVETGIGYPNDSIGNAYRIFESEAWRHYHWGRVGTPGGVLPPRFDLNPARTWVIPNYFDVEDWPLVETPEGNNIVFMSRFVVDKGIEMLRKIVKVWCELHDDDSKFVFAGMGGYMQWLAESRFSVETVRRIDHRGVVLGRDRAKLVGNARAFLLPSIFVEPFGGAGVEAMLTGTPLIGPSFGAFTETIEQGVTGFRCRTVEDYIEAIEQAIYLDRVRVRERAVSRYSLDACGQLYDKAFRTLLERASAE